MAHELVHFSLGGRRYALVPSRCSGGEAAECEPPEGGGRDPRHLLTAREMQIVQLICMGLLTKQVADRLHLSEFTVRSYLKTIYCKLGVRSRGGMVYAFTKVFGLSGATMAKAGESA
jgi:DNA-binding NarL/FixJ family response regulator